MRPIKQYEAKYLKERGLGRYVNMCNRTHKSRNKHYFVVESKAAMKALEDFKKEFVTQSN